MGFTIINQLDYFSGYYKIAPFIFVDCTIILFVDYLNIEDDLYQWRRSIAEINNLYNYQAFLAEADV